jgi:hypothetical protein
MKASEELEASFFRGTLEEQTDCCYSLCSDTALYPENSARNIYRKI